MFKILQAYRANDDPVFGRSKGKGHFQALKGGDILTSTKKRLTHYH